MNEFKECSNGKSELLKVADSVAQLSEKELNSPIENVELNSLTCQSECKYNTGHSSKSSNYGYSG
mgnify:CR=1 FL=1